MDVRGSGGTINRMSRKGAFAVFALAFSLSSHGAEVVHNDLVIRDAQVFATPPGARTAAAYLSIDNRGAANDELLGVTSSIGSASVHETSMEGGVMRMRSVDRLAVPAHGKVTLQPGGYHLMLEELEHPLRAGDKVSLRLTFEKAGTVEVVADVVPIGGARTSR